MRIAWNRALVAVSMGLVLAASVTGLPQASASVPSPAVALGKISFLDTEVLSGINSSVAIGTDGLGIISYRVASLGPQLMNLRVAHCLDVACTAATTTDIDTVGDVGVRSTIKIGSDGLPLISYTAERDANKPVTILDDLKVAHCHDIACTSATITTIDALSRVVHQPSLTIGADGLGLISYLDLAPCCANTTAKVKVAHCTNIACTSANVTTVDTVQSTHDISAPGRASITTGANGFGFISYQDDGSNQRLKVAACTNPDCTTKVISVVDQKVISGYHPTGTWASVTVGVDGFPLISYHYHRATAVADLRVAHCSNALCTASTLSTADAGGSLATTTAIAIGADGLGVISYWDGTNRDLKVAHCTNLACGAVTTKTVDAFGNVGNQSSITIGADGLPLISYLGDGPNGNILRVLHCGNADCTAPIEKPF